MKKKENKGSITVEAALFLPLFLFAFLSIYNLISFTRAQLIMQYAADQAAKEVAQYTYILEKIGILESLDKLNQTKDNFENDLKSIKNQLEVIQSAMEEATQGEDVIQNGVETGNALKDTYDIVQSYIDNPVSFIDGVLAAFKMNSIQSISQYMVNDLAKSCVLKQLSAAGGNIDPIVYQKNLGVSNLSMTETSWCANGSKDIKIVIDFYVTNDLPFFSMDPRHYRVCASTRVWSGV